MLRIAEIQKLLKIILDNRDIAQYNKSTTGTRNTTDHERKVNPMLNKFMVAGRLTADPEIKTVGDNRLCKFTIACERPKRKGEEKAQTDFFDCTAWNRNADVVVDWFGKGDMVTLVGAVHINRYEKDGQKRSAIEVKVEEIHFNGGKKRENTAPTDNGYDNPYAKTEDDPLF